jgi:hypothetical protein
MVELLAVGLLEACGLSLLKSDGVGDKIIRVLVTAGPVVDKVDDSVGPALLEFVELLATGLKVNEVICPALVETASVVGEYIKTPSFVTFLIHST